MRSISLICGFSLAYFGFSNEVPYLCIVDCTCTRASSFLIYYTNYGKQIRSWLCGWEHLSFICEQFYPCALKHSFDDHRFLDRPIMLWWHTLRQLTQKYLNTIRLSTESQNCFSLGNVHVFSKVSRWDMSWCSVCSLLFFLFLFPQRWRCFQRQSF